MKIRQLQALAALVEQGSVSAAAIYLNTPQPNLSRLLMALENEYSHGLFDRTGHKINVNPLGMMLYRRAKAIMAEINASKSDLASIKGDNIDNVRINCAPIAVEELLPSVISEMQKQGSGNNIILSGSSVDEPEERIRALKRGDCDIVVTLADEIKDKKGLAQKNLYNLQICIFASKDHPATQKKAPTIKSLYQFDWIFPSRNGKPAHAISRSFQRAFIKLPPKLLLVSNRNLIFSLLSQGSYLAPMLYHPNLTNHRLNDLDIIKISELNLNYPIALFTRDNYVPGHAAQSMINNFVNHGGQVA